MLTYLGTNTPYIVCKKNLGGYSTGVHLFPYRTEKLRPVAQMVLPYGGRVCHCLPRIPVFLGWDFFMTIINLSEFFTSNTSS